MAKIGLASGTLTSLWRVLMTPEMEIKILYFFVTKSQGH